MVGSLYLEDAGAAASEGAACSVRALGCLSADGARQAEAWQVAEEVPVAILVDSQPISVMMATPADLRDFAVGFLLCEGLVEDPQAIRAMLALPVEGGISVDVAVRPGALRRLPDRALEGRSGCGICGVREIARVLRKLPAVLPARLDPAALARAFAALPAHQPMNAVNRSVHAAAWCDSEGTIVLAREDIGRHNALDKLAGAIFRQGRDPAEGFAVLSSRCSFELVQKAATAGFAGLATLSAPTSLALEIAAGAGLALAARAGAGVMLFNPPESGST